MESSVEHAAIRRSDAANWAWRAAALALALVTVNVHAVESTFARRAAAPPALKSGIDLTLVDPAVRAQDDFDGHVNDRWKAASQIPPDKASYSEWDKLHDETELRLRGLIEAKANATDNAPGSDGQKIGDIYASFMDEAKLERLDVAPLRAQFARIDAIRNQRDIASIIAHFNIIGVDAPFTPQVHQDNKDSTRYVVDLVQTGLGLPDRDYYLNKDDAVLQRMLAKYYAHVAKMLAMSGVADADVDATAIGQLETELAKVQWTKVENRDPQKTYNKVEIPALVALAPEFDWTRYLRDAHFSGKVGYVIVSQPSYIAGFGKILASTPIAVWKAYFRWHLLSAYAQYLSHRFVDEDFAFSRGTLRGTPENRERWKRGIGLVEGSIGEGLGKLYVEKYFPPENKTHMEKLVANLLAAYRQSISTSDWMGPQTRQHALEKLAKFTPKIGYPAKWRDYSKLKISRDDLVGNVIRANTFEYERNVAKLGKPIDRGEWQMTPQTINAYYDPELNEIVFPAAILAPPFFDPTIDDAANYGAIGSIVGHEISHGFDDEGSQFDGEGNLNDWWTAEDHEKFVAKTKQLVDQYNAYEPLPDYHVNGALTLGENIADNSGLAIAYKAYRLSLGGNEAPVVDGLSGDQRFYMGFAQVWREKSRDAEVIRLIKIDPHSPSRFRANGAVVNQPGFYGAFGVKPGDKMYLPPEQRVIIW
jgi:putative endopeptidase